MAQTVQPVDNPNYAVPPLTTVSASIVSRRRVKVPVNFQGTYGPAKSGANYILTFDIADNESFIDLRKIVFCCDFTPSWVNPDPNYVVANNQVDYSVRNQELQQILPPIFDPTVDSLFFRIMIGTSQGLKIEEILNYSTFGAFVHQYTVGRTKKELDLMGFSDADKTYRKYKDIISFLESGQTLPANGAIMHGDTKRLEIRFNYSSALNRIRFLPAFLFRNGIRFELELEDVHRTFNYSISPNFLKMEKYQQNARTTQAIAAAMPFQSLNWWIAPGLYNPATGVNSIFNGPAGTSIIPYTGAAVGTNWNILPANDGSINTNIHMLCFPYEIGYQVMGKMTYVLGTVTDEVGATTVDPVKTDFVCVPFFITENGKLVYEAFFALSKVDMNTYLFTTGTSIQFLPFTNARTQAATYTVANYPNVGRFRFSATTANTGWVHATVPPIALDTVNANFIDLFGADQNRLSMFFPVYAYAKGGTDVPYLYKDVSTQALLQTYLINTGSLNAELYIDFDNTFTIPDTTLSKGTVNYDKYVSPNVTQIAINPKFIECFWPGANNTANKVIQWNYSLTNCEMLLDLVKPSSDIYQKFQQAYMSPAGIPYQYKRVIYKTQTTSGGSSTTAGLYSVNLNMTVRSLTGLVIIMQDPYFAFPGPPNGYDFAKYNIPLTSSFQRRGLARFEVVVGGQYYPVYQLLMKPMGKTTTGEYTRSTQLEAENFFGIPGIGGFNQNFNPIALEADRNYFLGGSLASAYSQADVANASNLAKLPGGYTAGITTPSIFDANAFALAMSLKKDDENDFTTGIDTSQSGSVILNFYFNATGSDQDTAAWIGRPVLIHIYAIADAILTVQNEAIVNRY